APLGCRSANMSLTTVAGHWLRTASAPSVTTLALRRGMHAVPRLRGPANGPAERAELQEATAAATRMIVSAAGQPIANCVDRRGYCTNPAVRKAASGTVRQPFAR